MAKDNFIFKRVEKKYLLTDAEQAVLLDRISPMLVPDKYGHSTISSLYLDTPDFRIIRASIEAKAWGHAYKEKLGTIYITVRILENNKVSIKIRDRGCGIPDIAQAMEPLYSSLGGERAGLGFAVMQSFTDKLTVSSKLGRGTTVIMHKKIRSLCDE